MNDDCCYKLYMHLNKTNGKVYIGQTKTSYFSRWRNGRAYGGCPMFAKAIKKYGWHEGFEHIPLIEGLFKSEADYFERFFIEFFDSQNPEFGYNLTAGGDECPMDNPVNKEKHSKAIKKRSENVRWRTNVFNALSKKVVCIETGVVYDSITKAAISIGMADGSHISDCCKGKRKRCGGYHWEYLDETLKNKYGKYVSPDKPTKKVLCVETGIIYSSIKEASKMVGLKSKGCICMCCRGRQKTAGGYHWEYA